MSALADFIDRMMKDFTSDLKRMNNLFEDDADNMEVGGKLSANGGTGEEDVPTPISSSTALPITYASRTSRMRLSPFNSSRGVSRYEIQIDGSANKDVVQGPGVTGRQPVLKPGESFEYTYTAPLSVRPMADKTKDAQGV